MAVRPRAWRQKNGSIPAGPQGLSSGRDTRGSRGTRPHLPSLPPAGPEARTSATPRGRGLQANALPSAHPPHVAAATLHVPRKKHSTGLKMIITYDFSARRSSLGLWGAG